VWRALTADRAGWSPELRFEPVVGAALEETWTIEDEVFVARGEVLEVCPPRLVVFEWHEPTWAAPLRVRFSIEDADPTSVTVTEDGFERLDGGRELRDEHTDGWEHHLANLVRFTAR
jgi:uncharacterized protein YndB with AHSA1/START domain